MIIYFRLIAELMTVTDPYMQLLVSLLLYTGADPGFDKGGDSCFTLSMYIKCKFCCYNCIVYVCIVWCTIVCVCFSVKEKRP